MSRLHLLTFGDGSYDLRAAAGRVGQQAAQQGVFASISALTTLDIRRDNPDFWNSHRDFILKNRRGFGFYVWKPHIILQALEKIPRGDVLLWIDAGCEIRENRGHELRALAEQTEDILLFRIARHSVGEWTNSFTLDAIGVDEDILQRDQFAATVMFLRHTDASLQLCADWAAWASRDNCGCLIDRPYRDEREPFIEHRHDQSILSILIHKYRNRGELRLRALNMNLLDMAAAFPIAASRNRTGVSRLKKNAHLERLSYNIKKAFNVLLSGDDLLAPDPQVRHIAFPRPDVDRRGSRHALEGSIQGAEIGR